MPKLSTGLLTTRLKTYAQSIGFQDVGISKAQELTKEAKRLEEWLSKNLNGEMDYMTHYFDRRIDPKKLHPGTQSIISLSYNYFIEEPDQNKQNVYKISKYARGRDYHKVVKKKLKELIQWLKLEVGDINARGFVDSAPVMERAWAERSGIGWIGKNTMLLTKSKGSYFFLAEIFVDINLECDHPVKNYCGTCTRCIDACPTQAISEPFVVNANQCISYLTIEYKKESLPSFYAENAQNWIFGCDICQEVCPINARAQQHHEPEFGNKAIFQDTSVARWSGLTEAEFNSVFHDSAIKRTGYKGLMRNIRAIGR